ncbi:AGC family protein kinase [Tritrichomonas foetus]|uniref:AGC family protein kinase n=1 Tax=Tritrichomonas foetus TaxID=1144522 RepID=A0A1J4KTR3_9EUKA|nr:AGC family protein kinase [Tritrichomonas foetus]|eukprot:OHT14304.1 AGC family protein kinase [Tritrichomonas foetus]
MANFDIDLSLFEQGAFISKGSFGSIFKVIRKKDSKVFAAKISQTQFDETSSVEKLQLLREVAILGKLKHPSIIGFIGFSKKNFKNENFPTIITEYCENGSLRDILQSELMSASPPGWDSTKKLCMIYGIVSGMAYLHRQHIIHRDVKPENILIDSNLLPKITDFGLSKVANNNLMTMFGGTYYYIAPEIISQEQYDEKIDVYSFGVILFELLSGLDIQKVMPLTVGIRIH